MVARLSNRCFLVVLQIPNLLNHKVTQGDFMAGRLYNKSKEEQFRLLSDVLEEHISFQELKRQKVIRCCIFFLNLVLRKLIHFLSESSYMYTFLLIVARKGSVIKAESTNWKHGRGKGNPQL